MLFLFTRTEVFTEACLKIINFMELVSFKMLRVIDTRESGKKINLMEKDSNIILTEVDMRENLERGKNRVKLSTPLLMAKSTKDSLRMGIWME